MVSTRNHKGDFPEATPSKTLSQPTPIFGSSPPREWRHKPDHTTVAWLLVSLPLVIWDTIYVLFRPHTMPGGSMNWPIYTPYDLYGTVDYVYGEKAWRERNGFTAAQASLNVVETVGYLGYLYVLWKYGQGEKRVLLGGWGGVACLTGFALSVMTVSKTVLYCE